MHTCTWANFSDNVTFGKMHDMVLHYLDHICSRYMDIAAYYM